MTPATMIEKYIELRRYGSTIKAKHEEELAPIAEAMRAIETELLRHLNEAGTDSMKCKQGTAYKSTVTSVTVQEWQQTLSFIIDNKHWDLLEARVSKGVALDIVDTTKKPIPGVQITQAVALRVRAS